jgi:hypothetical protein
MPAFGVEKSMVSLRKVLVEKPAKPAKRPGKSKSKKAAATGPGLFDRAARGCGCNRVNMNREKDYKDEKNLAE